MRCMATVMAMHGDVIRIVIKMQAIGERMWDDDIDGSDSSSANGEMLSYEEFRKKMGPGAAGGGG